VLAADDALEPELVRLLFSFADSFSASAIPTTKEMWIIIL